MQLYEGTYYNVVKNRCLCDFATNGCRGFGFTPNCCFRKQYNIGACLSTYICNNTRICVHVVCVLARKYQKYILRGLYG